MILDSFNLPSDTPDGFGLAVTITDGGVRCELVPPAYGNGPDALTPAGAGDNYARHEPEQTVFPPRRNALAA